MMTRVIATLALLAPVAAIAAPQPGTVCEARWIDAARGGRSVPVRIRMPAGSGKVPVILFSHGLGGSLDSGTLWAEAWVHAGLAVVNVQHPGSDRSILAHGDIRNAMMPQQLAARVGDIHFVIDELARRPREGACDLGRLDLSRIGMSGHSFGAHTTQAIAGQHFPGDGGNRFPDPRVKAAIAFSPSPPFRISDADAFGNIRLPFLSITGTDDVVPLTPQISAADRQRPFRAMPPGGKYLLVLKGANHMAFNGQDGLPSPNSAPDPRIAAVTIDATTAFWRWTLLDDRAAKRRLDGLGAQLAPGDDFETR